MVLDQEMLRVKQFFDSIQITLSDLWLESCINWYREENNGSSYTEKQIQNEVYSQWLLLDLREAEVAVLPSNLSQHKKIVVNGTFCLQMQCIYDVAKPKYWQLQRIRDSNTLKSLIQQDKEITDSKRMLQMTLTDGVQEIDAIEHSHISALNINLKPGTKVQITGPLTVRRGKMFLEERNVKILGGEVEDILVSNVTENFLARSLGFPENPNPQNVSEDFVDKIENVPVSLNNQNFNRDMPSTSNYVPPSSNTTFKKPESTKIIPKHVPEIALNDDDFDTCDFSKLDQIETELSSKSQEIINISDESDDIFNDIDIDSHLNEIDKKIKKEQQTDKILTIEQLSDLKRAGKEGIFKVKAKYKSIAQKLSIENELWSLQIVIEDDQMHELSVSMDSNVISNLMGYFPSQMMALKNSVNSNSEAKHNIIKVIIKNVENSCITFTIFFFL